MKWFKFLALALITVLVYFYVSKPSPEEVEKYVHAVAISQLQAKDLEPSATVLENAALMGCKLDPDSCYDVLRKLIDINYEDKFLYAKITITGIGPSNHCYAVANRVFCTGTDPE